MTARSCSRTRSRARSSRSWSTPARSRSRSSGSHGRPTTLVSRMKRFHVTTFGCQMNEHDSERMKGMLESLGYTEVPERGEADLILFNTCSIREKADERFVSHLYEARALKRKDPEREIGRAHV